MSSSALQTVEEQVRRMVPVTAPSSQQAEVAALLQVLDGAQGEFRLVGPFGRSVPLPESVFYLLERVVEGLASGDAITVVPVGKEVTTQQAANLLNVSRQYLVRLLDDSKIPHRKIGQHRRLRVEDVLAFKQSRDKNRKAGLRELSQMTEEFGGYDSEQ